MKKHSLQFLFASLLLAAACNPLMGAFYVHWFELPEGGHTTVNCGLVSMIF